MEDTALLAVSTTVVDHGRNPRRVGALVGCFWAAGKAATLGSARARPERPRGPRASDAAASSAVRVQVFYAGGTRTARREERRAAAGRARRRELRRAGDVRQPGRARRAAARGQRGRVQPRQRARDGRRHDGRAGSVDQRCVPAQRELAAAAHPRRDEAAAHERPLTLVETSTGAAARASRRRSTTYRNSYGAGGNASDGGGGGGGGRAGPMAHAAFFPYGVEYCEVDEIGDFLLHATCRAAARRGARRRARVRGHDQRARPCCNGTTCTAAARSRRCAPRARGST